MAGEGFQSGRPDDPGVHDPARAAREAADRIAAQVRDILGTAEHRAVEIRERAERDADSIREDAAGAAARLLKRLDMLEADLERNLTAFFHNMRSEVEALASREAIEEAQRTQRLDEPPAAPAHEPPEEEAEQPFEEAPPEPAEEPRRRRGLLWGRRPREEGEEDGEPGEPTDAEDAHVMALNMALNGTPRNETRDYLHQRFGEIDDLESILNDVYGRVKGR